MAVGSINSAKELELTYQPLLLAEFTFTDGTVLRTSTHGLRNADGGFQYNGNDYFPRVLNQDIEATQILSSSGVCMPPSVSIRLNDADGSLWANYEKLKGFKGAFLVLRFIFWNVDSNDFSSDYLTPFLGICSAPSSDDITLTVFATSLLSMEQVSLPPTRIQRTCPWIFPVTALQRQDGADNPDSFFYRCGYSPDATGLDARGNYESGTTPFTSCAFTKPDCQARGMYTQDASSRLTGRFGGVQWDAPGKWSGREYSTGNRVDGVNASNDSKYGDFVPLIYGTAWVDPVVLNVVGDANATQFEVLLCEGKVEEVIRVLVNDVEVPQYNAGSDTVFNWVQVTSGGRYGAPDVLPGYDSKGDPYGNLAVLHLIVPRKLAESSSLPRVRVLVKGPLLRKYQALATVVISGGIGTATLVGANTDIASNDPFYRLEIVGNSYSAADCAHGPLTNWTGGPPGTVEFTTAIADGSGSGGYIGYGAYADNPVWVLLDVLVRAGWSYSEIDLDAFIAAAATCDEPISYKDKSGNTATHERYRCSLVIRQRTSAAEVIRGLCTSANLILVPGQDGKLKAIVKQTLAEQQPAPIAGSNYNTAVASKLSDGTAADGYVAYKFDLSNVVRRNGTAQFRITQRINLDTPNRVGFTFQDEDNSYELDSVSVVDSDAVARSNQETSGGSLPICGVPNYDQARRVIATSMAESYRGNPRSTPLGDAGGTIQVELETTFKVIHLRIGQLVLLSWPQRDIADQLMRVIRIQPTTNFESTKVTLQWHSDEWYLDTWGQEDAPRYSAQRRNRVARPPYPIFISRRQLLTTIDPLWPDERPDWGMISAKGFGSDISDHYVFRISGTLPVNAPTDQIRSPFTPIQGTTASTGGNLPGGIDVYAGLVAVDSAGNTTMPGTLTKISIPTGTDTNTATVNDIDWDSGTVSYRRFLGTNPTRLYWYGDVSGAPSSVTFGDPLTDGGDFPIPDTELDVLRAKIKRVFHAGDFGATITDTTSTTIECLGAMWSTNEWANRVISVVGLDKGGLFDLPAGYNFKVASNTSDTLTVDTAYGPPPTQINPAGGDNALLIMRAQATTFSDTTIGDAKFDNTLALEDPLTIEDATNASPIVVKVTAHGYSTGKRVRIADVLGNTAANGIQAVTVVDADHFSLDSTTGNGAYTGGGNARGLTGGLAINAEVGRIVRIIAGTGKGQWAFIKSNTQTVLTIEGKWAVTPDATSIFWIEEATWQRQQDIQIADVSTFAPSVVPEFPLDVSGLERQVCMLMPVGVDGGGAETLENSAQYAIRDFYLFHATGSPQQARSASVILTVDGTLAIGSDLTPRTNLGDDAKVSGVRLEVKQAPSGADLVVVILVDGTAWMTLAIPDGSTSVDASQADIDGAAMIPAGANIRLDIAGCGTTFPGSDLSAFLYV